MGNKVLWMYDCEFIWWDDGEIPYEKKYVKCLVAGYSLTDVVDKICQWYGNTAIEDISIKIIDETEEGIMHISCDKV